MDARPTLVVFGASGDMAGRLLFPALYSLDALDRLPDLTILGQGLEPWTEEGFTHRVREGIEAVAGVLDDRAWNRFAARLSYCHGDLGSDSIATVASKVHGPAMFYLALPPGMFAEAASVLAEHGLHDQTAGWRRLIIEKPFGTDVESALALNADLHRHWTEEQIFRIDHYLGKETVQNLLVFRFANRFLEPVLNSQHVAQVQITAAETIGIEGRYRYYDGIGALRDMLQNHLMQLFTLTAIEPPALWDSDILRSHKVEVLKAVRPILPSEVPSVAVRGQYVGGKVNGDLVPGYRDEEGIHDASETETFAAVKLFIDTWRWKGVPFYLRSGKRMAKDVTEIAIQFREPATWLFRSTPLEHMEPSWLVFSVRPDEAIRLTAIAKQPGLELEARELLLEAHYSSGRPRREESSAAYAQLLLDVIEGDATPFLRFDEVEWAWRVLQPVLDAWQSGAPELYRSGTWGPNGQHSILEPGHRWRDLSREHVHP
jgi:glucose-6-phosphate 1-dehydrogenase